MRRNVRRLSWTLWLVIAAFIILYIPDLVAGGGGDVVAKVDGDPITVGEFRQALGRQLDLYRQLNQGQLPEGFADSAQVRSVVLEQLIRRRLLLAAARDQGFAVAPQEIKDRIMEYPVFRDDQDRWVGDQEYIAILRRNGLDPAEFEQSVIDDLLVERLTRLITDGVAVSDEDLQRLYQRQNERVRLEFIQVRPGAFEAEVTDAITEDEVRARYDRDPDAYRLPERRRITYALVDTEAIRDQVHLDEDRLRREYEAAAEEYTIPEQIKARQILFRVPPAADEQERSEIRQRAEQARERLLAGADFAELARELSDDPSAAAGGDLGWVTKGRQVEGFDEVAFALAPGETSAVFETPFGFHIVRVEEHRDAQVQPFEEVRGQLEQRLAWEEAERQAERLAQQIRREVLGGASLEEVAEQHDLQLDASPLFSRQEGFAEFTSPEFLARVFALGSGRVAEPVRVRRGYIVFRVDEIDPPHTPEFDEVEARVRRDVIRERARARARQVAAELVERIAAGEEPAALAAEVGASVEATEAITRDDPVSGLGRSPKLLEAAFALDSGQAGGPVEVEGRFVVFRVIEHQQPDWSAFADRRESVRQQELINRRNRLFEAFVQSLRERYSVVVYDSVLEQLRA